MQYLPGEEYKLAVRLHTVAVSCLATRCVITAHIGL